MWDSKHVWKAAFSLWIGIAAISAIPAHSNADGPKRECPLYGVDNIFEPSRWPMADLDSFARGNLGVLMPSYDHFYLLIAYRLLDQLPVTDDDLNRLRDRDPCWERPGRSGSTDQWIVQRRAVDGMLPLDRVSAQHLHPKYRYADFLNCNPDAFRTAARTLASRVSQYGQADEVREWVKGQDLVFANCAAGLEPPPDVSEKAPEWLKYDRKYQQAAAEFYAGHYDEAVHLFDQIAKTQESPWRQVAPYVAARALIRATTTQQKYGMDLDQRRLKDAQTRLSTMLQGPLEDSLRSDVLRLLQFVRLRTEPKEMLRELDERLRAPRLPESVRQDVVDFWTAYARTGGSESRSDFSRWLASFRGGVSATEATASWNSSHQLRWLVAALSLLKVREVGEAGSLLDDARRIPPESPAYLTVHYHLIRLLPSEREAVAIADRLLRAIPPLSAQDANRIKRVALTRAYTVDQIARFSPRTSTYATRGAPPTVDGDGGRLLNSSLPIDVLVRIWRTKNLPEPFKRQLTLMIWVRAFVLQRWDICRGLAKNLEALLPNSAEFLGDIQNSRDVGERRALGAMFLARYPGLVGNIDTTVSYEDTPNEFSRPNMHRSFDQDGERENWWCAFPNEKFWKSPIGRSDQAPEFSTLTSKEQSALRRERALLDKATDATTYLGEVVLSWARAHPTDARLPRALHMVVHSSRGGCVGPGALELSRSAYRHLHQYFPTSEWTVATPYYYGW